jgi:hypothetical protein
MTRPFGERLEFETYLIKMSGVEPAPDFTLLYKIQIKLV